LRDYASLKALLLSDLGLTGSEDNHYFVDDGYQLAARKSLASSFYKKLQPGGLTRIPDEAALIKFRQINQGLPSGPHSFLANNEAESCFHDYFRNNLRVALEPHESLGAFDLDFIRGSMMVGPGSAQKADSAYMVSKLFESAISYTDDRMIPIYRAALSETGLWADAEMQRFQTFGFVRVRGGKIFFALKNAEISRTCCTEASLNMLFQKAAGEFIEQRLEYFFGISLKKQPDFNRELARIGSLNGSFGTVDLVSASDSIGLFLFRRDFPTGVLKTTMEMSRSTVAVLPDGDEEDLQMISTMGNGFTFPLQTLIFASAVRAVYQVMGFPCFDPKTQFGVFGDDIVVRREAYDFLNSMLAKLGFTVNVGKSFNTGPFRESCGHDYYDGMQIRGVYIRSLETPQNVYSAINRLTRWSGLHGIPLTSTIRTLLSWVRDIRIPLSESDDAGFKVPFKFTQPRVTDNYWFNYRCYVRRVKRLRVLEPDSDDPPINSMGVGVGFLAGHIRRRDFVLKNPEDSSWHYWKDLDVPIRDRPGARARYKITNKCLPFWDYRPSCYADDALKEGAYQCVVLTDQSYDSWEGVITALLG